MNIWMVFLFVVSIQRVSSFQKRRPWYLRCNYKTYWPSGSSKIGFQSADSDFEVGDNYVHMLETHGRINVQIGNVHYKSSPYFEFNTKFKIGVKMRDVTGKVLILINCDEIDKTDNSMKPVGNPEDEKKRNDDEDDNPNVCCGHGKCVSPSDCGCRNGMINIPIGRIDDHVKEDKIKKDEDDSRYETIVKIGKENKFYSGKGNIRVGAIDIGSVDKKITVPFHSSETRILLKGGTKCVFICCGKDHSDLFESYSACSTASCVFGKNECYINMN